MAINVVIKSFFLGFFRIFFGSLSASFEHVAYSPVFSEYGVLMLSVGFLGLLGLFSKSVFRVAPSILFGMYLLLVSLLHWIQLDSKVLLYPSRHYLLINFDIVTAIVLFYHSWVLNGTGLLRGSPCDKRVML